MTAPMVYPDGKWMCGECLELFTDVHAFNQHHPFGMCVLPCSMQSVGLHLIDDAWTVNPWVKVVLQ